MAKRKKFDKEYFLRLLAERVGKMEACRRMGVDDRAYRYHMKSDALFRERVKAMDRRESLLKPEAEPDPVEDTRTWKEIFLDHYAEFFDRVEAAVYAGVRTTEVRDALSPTHPKYDLEFHRKFDDIDINVEWQIRDGIRRDATKADAPTSVRKAALDLSKSELGQRVRDAKLTPEGESDAFDWIKATMKDVKSAAVN